MSSLIGNRYGEAFFEAGRDENCLDSLYDDVCLLRGVLGENEDFLKVMNAPSVAKEERSRLLDTIFDGNLQPLTLNYLHLLVDKSRFGALQDSLEKFIELYRESKGITCEVDPALISGIRLQMNGEQFDSSVRRRLENLKTSIESAVF